MAMAGYPRVGCGKFWTHGRKRTRTFFFMFCQCSFPSVGQKLHLRAAWPRYEGRRVSASQARRDDQAARSQAKNASRVV
jgi:hypothetical protein